MSLIKSTLVALLLMLTYNVFAQVNLQFNPEGNTMFGYSCETKMNMLQTQSGQAIEVYQMVKKIYSFEVRNEDAKSIKSRYTNTTFGMNVLNANPMVASVSAHQSFNVNSKNYDANYTLKLVEADVAATDVALQTSVDLPSLHDATMLGVVSERMNVDVETGMPKLSAQVIKFASKMIADSEKSIMYKAYACEGKVAIGETTLNKNR